MENSKSSKKKIALIVPSQRFYGSRNWQLSFLAFDEPIGMCYLTSVLRKNGYVVEIYNDFYCYNIKEKLKNLNQYLLIGIYGGHEGGGNEAFELAESLRKEGYEGHITIGGRWPTLMHDLILKHNPHINSVIRGEGEFVILSLAKTLSTGGSLEKIKGISFRSKGRVLINPRDKHPNINIIPYPARDFLYTLLRLNIYPKIRTSRSCNGNCTFCINKPFYGHKWIYRNISDVIDEISFLKNFFNIKRTEIIDEDFLGGNSTGLERAFLFSEFLKKENIEVEYCFDCRVDEVNYALFKELKSSGCFKVFLGVENINERALNTYNKGFTSQRIWTTLDILKKLNLEVEIGYIWYDPFTSIEELENTLDFFKKCASFCMITGTPLVIIYRTPVYYIFNNYLISKNTYNPNTTYNFKDPIIKRFDDYMCLSADIVAPFEQKFNNIKYEINRLLGDLIVHRIYNTNIFDFVYKKFSHALWFLDKEAHNIFAVDVFEYCLNLITCERKFDEHELYHLVLPKYKSIIERTYVLLIQLRNIMEAK